MVYPVVMTETSTAARSETGQAGDAWQSANNPTQCAIQSPRTWRVLSWLSLELRRLNGLTLRCDLPFADELSALVLKSLATTVRSKDTDITDVWRCLEVAFAAGIGPAEFTSGTRADSARLIRTLFGSRHGAPMAALAAEERLSTEAADERFTRIQALIARVLGP